MPMERLPCEGIDTRAALASLPPLIKGYLRIGAGFGDGAVVDHQFGTTDVLVVLPVSRITARYIAPFRSGCRASRLIVALRLLSDASFLPVSRYPADGMRR